MKSLKQILDDPTSRKAALGAGKSKYVTREWQDFGYRLAMELADPEHVSLYIKLAKNEDRVILEQARRFAIGSNAGKKGALFMWKLGELRKLGRKVPM